MFPTTQKMETSLLQMRAIGHIESCFKYKNGTPRQPGVCSAARGRLIIDSALYTCPEHSLEGLHEFSHVWIVFLFHKNNNAYNKAKVKPPRLNGKKTGVFSTRSPYRPNAIGLTLAKVESIEGASLYLSGIDMLDGTPVLDVKPYIETYDRPSLHDRLILQEKLDDDEVEIASDDVETSTSETQEPTASQVDLLSLQASCDAAQLCASNKHVSEGILTDENAKHSSPSSDVTDLLDDSNIASGDNLCNSHADVTKSCSIVKGANRDNLNKSAGDNISTSSPSDVSSSVSAAWISAPPIDKINVRFTNNAQRQMEQFSTNSADPLYALQHLESSQMLEKAIRDILAADPRSTYRRTKCSDRLYFFIVDNSHVTCWFDGNTAEVVRVQPAVYGHPDLAGKRAQTQDVSQ